MILADVGWQAHCQSSSATAAGCITADGGQGIVHRWKAFRARELTAVVEKMMADYEKMDFDAVTDATTHDAQGIDELSRKWMRTRKDLANYFKQVAASVTKIHDSKIRDVHEMIVGDVGFLTCWLEQDYTLEGKRQHISSPTTVILKREDRVWKITMFHSLPLPEANS